MDLSSIFEDEGDRWLADDLLKSLGPVRLILHGRNAEGFVKKLGGFYNKEREKGLFILDGLLNADFDELTKIRLERAKRRMIEVTFDVGDLFVKEHNNRETFVKCSSNVRGKHIDLVHLFDDPDKGLSELVIIGDTLRRAGATGVDLYLPFIPYQREDKKDEGRVPLAAKLAFNMIKEAYGDTLKRIVTMDLHAAQEQGFIDLPVDHLHFLNIFGDYVLSKQFKERHPGDYVVAALDPGGVKKASKLAALLGMDYIVLDKKRTEHGRVSIEDRNIEDKVGGKNVLGIEDMIDTGNSVAAAYNNLMGYKAKSFTLGACHGLLSPQDGSSAESKLRDCKKLNIVVGDSIPKPDGYYETNKEWLTALSVTKNLAQVMIANRMNFSVSSTIRRHEQYIKEVVKGKKPPTNVDEILLVKY